MLSILLLALCANGGSNGSETDPGTALAYRHHGPTGLGGITVPSAKIIAPGAALLSFSTDLTFFNHFDADEIQKRTLDQGEDPAHFDAIRSTATEMVGFRYGVADNFDVNGAIGWYRGTLSREGELDGGVYELHDNGRIDGWTDLWLSGKYRFAGNEHNQFSAILTAKLPVGRDNLKNKDGETLEPDHQPGTGAFDLGAGVASTFVLGSHWGLDAAASYTRRFKHEDFKLGDRCDLGVSVSYQIQEGAIFPRVTFIGEASVLVRLKNEEDEDRDENSGGTILFLTPGIRVAINPRVELMFAPQFPVVQSLNGEQQESTIKVVFGVTFSL